MLNIHTVNQMSTPCHQQPTDTRGETGPKHLFEAEYSPNIHTGDTPKFSNPTTTEAIESVERLHPSAVVYKAFEGGLKEVLREYTFEDGKGLNSEMIGKVKLYLLGLAYRVNADTYSWRYGRDTMEREMEMSYNSILKYEKVLIELDVVSVQLGFRNETTKLHDENTYTLNIKRLESFAVVTRQAEIDRREEMQARYTMVQPLKKGGSSVEPIQSNNNPFTHTGETSFEEKGETTSLDSVGVTFSQSPDPFAMLALICGIKNVAPDTAADIWAWVDGDYDKLKLFEHYCRADTEKVKNGFLTFPNEVKILANAKRHNKPKKSKGRGSSRINSQQVMYVHPSLVNS